MKKLGILGGVAWPSTIDYYRAICRMSVARHVHESLPGPPAVPEMSIESLNINKSYGLRGGTITDDVSWAKYDQYFREALQRLEAGGAELAIIASSTPHNRLSAITQGIRIPVLGIFEAVAQECAQLGVKEVLILGTAPTMDAPVFSEALSRFGVRGYAPRLAEERVKLTALVSELYAGHGVDAASRLRSIVDNSCPKTSPIRTVCLACTELPMAFPAIEQEASLVIDGICYVNSTIVHARAAFAAICSSEA